VLVRRDAEGKVHVKDNLHEVGIVTGVRVIGGALIGLIFPPSILAAAVVGGGIGAGAGGLLDHHRKSEIKHDPPRRIFWPWRAGATPPTGTA